eukprot:TRINITY_DN5437_c0_g2_i2.p2 TRINITY_DN5437_c0_g2~~TRINITY_DN5437_c0_g2_i2.p2  ORF type:complete len:102 (+),score=5.70 TRINITY_DN5437_c0_g2_i2:189-494(+)
MAAGSKPLPDNMLSTVWRDDTFLHSTTLDVHTVLKYFSRSPFYDPNCNNEECERQGRSLEDLRAMGAGLEFVVIFASEPDLYVIKRQYRENCKMSASRPFV